MLTNMKWTRTTLNLFNFTERTAIRCNCFHYSDSIFPNQTNLRTILSAIRCSFSETHEYVLIWKKNFKKLFNPLKYSILFILLIQLPNYSLTLVVCEIPKKCHIFNMVIYKIEMKYFLKLLSYKTYSTI